MAHDIFKVLISTDGNSTIRWRPETQKFNSDETMIAECEAIVLDSQDTGKFFQNNGAIPTVGDIGFICGGSHRVCILSVIMIQ